MIQRKHILSVVMGAVLMTGAQFALAVPVAANDEFTVSAATAGEIQKGCAQEDSKDVVRCSSDQIARLSPDAQKELQWRSSDKWHRVCRRHHHNYFCRLEE